MADLEVQVNKDNVNLDNDVKIVFVVLRNQTVYNKKKKRNDEYTNILRVFETESKAAEFVAAKIQEKGKNENIQYYSIPTVYGDI